MRSSLRACCALAAATLAFATPAQSDPRVVKYYAETCGACHGEKGEGIPGLAPALKGNKFVTDGSTGDIAQVITKGREAAAKKYKDLPSPMPPQSMSDSRLQALIAYLKAELQR